MTDVTDFPLWPDFPFAARVPSWLEIRRGKWEVDGEEPRDLLVLWSPQYEIHCDCHFEPSELTLSADDFTRRVLEPMLGNLGGAVFDKLHPDEYLKMIRRRATGEDLSDSDIALWVEYERLTKPVKASASLAAR